MPAPPPATIRLARPDDEPAIVACVNAAYERFIAAIGAKPAPMLDDYAQFIALERVWVAEIDATLAGLIVMWAEDDHWYVDNIAVDPQRQGQCIGCLLLDAAERARLNGLVSKGKAPAKTILKARILLKADTAKGAPAWFGVEGLKAHDPGVTMVSRGRETFVLEGLDAGLFGDR